MANQNGHHSGQDIEHGYQDWRDQRDRERGRDDFRGLDRDARMGSPRHNTGEHGDRYQGGGQWSQGGRDQYAERDRDMYGDHERDRGYGFNDGDRGDKREQMTYRGQSGSQAGNRYGTENTNYPNQQGGNRGHWGDFDRGGQSSQSGWNTQQGFAGQQAMRGPHAGKGPQGFQRSDERIKELVHEALTDHEHLDATHITVDVKSGEVVLTGTVDDRPSKRLAEDIVERVSGVADVQNQLRVSTSTNTSHMTPNPSNKSTKPS